MDQNEIERLLNSKGEGEGGDAPAEQGPADSGGPPAEQPEQAASPGGDQALDQSEIESLLSGAGAKPASAPAQEATAQAEVEDGDKMLDQGDIEKLLGQAGKAPPASQAEQKAQKQKRQSAPTSGQVMAGEGDMPQEDLDYLLNQAERALESVDSDESDLPQGVSAFRLEEFPGAPPSSESATLDLIRDVELDLKIELGRTHMYLEDVLKLRKGSVVPLDKLAGDPVDVYVNGRLIARGEVLVLNENFCVRVAELIAGVHHF
jgi:flagellar motor switch protein FliN/FliY